MKSKSCYLKLACELHIIKLFTEHLTLIRISSKIDMTPSYTPLINTQGNNKQIKAISMLTMTIIGLFILDLSKAVISECSTGNIRMERQHN